MTEHAGLPPRYRDPERVARGGMGEVYRATDSVLGRTVAIKVLAEHLADDEGIRRRFTREALAAARLSNTPNIVTIFDVGEHDGRPYIVMEYVAERLARRPHRRRRRPAARPRAGVARVRSRQRSTRRTRAAIVHRDVKPGNLLLDEEGAVHVADFGVASAVGLDSFTAAGTVLGTAGYLAPEQARGEPTTPAVDSYALAVVAFELLTGTRPYQRRLADGRGGRTRERADSIGERGQPGAAAPGRRCARSGPREGTRRPLRDSRGARRRSSRGARSRCRRDGDRASRARLTALTTPQPRPAAPRRPGRARGRRRGTRGRGDRGRRHARRDAGRATSPPKTVRETVTAEGTTVVTTVTTAPEEPPPPPPHHRRPATAATGRRQSVRAQRPGVRADAGGRLRGGAAAARGAVAGPRRLGQPDRGVRELQPRVHAPGPRAVRRRARAARIARSRCRAIARRSTACGRKRGERPAARPSRAERRTACRSTRGSRPSA